MRDDGLQILVYVIIGIATLIGGIIKNSAKKKEEEQRRARQAEARRRSASDEDQPVPTVSSNPFEEFLKRQMEQYEEQFNQDEEEIIEKEAPVVIQTQQNSYAEGNAVFESTGQTLISDNMNDDDFSIADTIKDSLEETEKEEEIYNYNYNKELEDEITDKTEQEVFFDARKALIYSEIFKRPEY